MKNKVVPTIYRIFVILTFLCGSFMMYWFGRFSVYAIEDADPKDAGVVSCLGSFGISFFALAMMIAVCFILSIVCFRAAKPLLSIIRTFFTAVAGGLCVPAAKLMLVFIRYASNAHNPEYLKNIDLESDIYLIFFIIPAYSIIMVLFVTSAIALVTGPVIRSDESDSDEQKSKKKKTADTADENKESEKNSDGKSRKEKVKK